MAHEHYMSFSPQPFDETHAAMQFSSAFNKFHPRSVYYTNSHSLYHYCKEQWEYENSCPEDVRQRLKDAKALVNAAYTLNTALNCCESSVEDKIHHCNTVICLAEEFDQNYGDEDSNNLACGFGSLAVVAIIVLACINAPHFMLTAGAISLALFVCCGINVCSSFCNPSHEPHHEDKDAPCKFATTFLNYANTQQNRLFDKQADRKNQNQYPSAPPSYDESEYGYNK